MEPLTKTRSYKHQAEIIEQTKDKRYFGYLMEQGTGKTHVTIAVMTHLFRTGKIDGVLILAPNGVHDNWTKIEIPLHCALDEGDYLTATWHGSDGVRKRAYWEYVAMLDPKEKPLVILSANIEATRTDAFMSSIRPFMNLRRFLLVVDESTVIKNPKADQTKATMKIAKNAAYSRILTGTPITQSPLDLWSQCRVLAEDALPYTSYTAFKHMFAVEQAVTFGHRSFNKIVGYQNQQLLASLIAPFTVRVLKKDCLDLPEKIYQTRYVELTPEQKRHYKDLERQCFTMIDKDAVTITAIITKMLRLHQITLGYVETDDGVMHQIPHNRGAALTNLLETECSGKTIIFGRFLQDIQQILKIIGELTENGADAWAVKYTGEEDPVARTQAVDSFQNDPRCKYFVATKAAARGLTLTAAENVVYYSQDFSLEARLQSEDRAHRIGQKKNVTYTDLVARGTIDDRVVEALKKKTDLATSVLTAAQLRQLIKFEE